MIAAVGAVLVAVLVLLYLAECVRRGSWLALGLFALVLAIAGNFIGRSTVSSNRTQTQPTPKGAP